MKLIYKTKDIYSWHDWFAWYPVRVYKKGQDENEKMDEYTRWVWLEKIEIRRMASREFTWWFRRMS